MPDLEVLAAANAEKLQLDCVLAGLNGELRIPAAHIGASTCRRPSPTSSVGAQVYDSTIRLRSSGGPCRTNRLIVQADGRAGGV